MLGTSVEMYLLLLVLLGMLGMNRGEVEVTVARVSASKWSLRNASVKGCGPLYGDGCSPGYLVDGKYNDVPSSRWSCKDNRVLPLGPCYADFDLGISYSLSYLLIYFYRGNDPARTANIFDLSVSEDGYNYTVAIKEAENLLPTPLGMGNAFPFESGVTGRFVRMTGVNSNSQFLGVNEVRFFVNMETPAPGATTPEVTATPSPSSAVQPVEPSTAPEAPTPTIMPTVVGTDPDTSVTESPVVGTPVPETPMPSAYGHLTGDSNVTSAIDVIEEEGARVLTKAIVAWGLLGVIILLYILLGGLLSWPRKAPNPLTTLPAINISVPEDNFRKR